MSLEISPSLTTGLMFVGLKLLLEGVLLILYKFMKRF